VCIWWAPEDLAAAIRGGSVLGLLDARCAIELLGSSRLPLSADSRALPSLTTLLLIRTYPDVQQRRWTYCKTASSQHIGGSCMSPCSLRT
jgi:hypothetical protein